MYRDLSSGSIVEFTNGEAGIIVASQEKNKPASVLIVLNAQKEDLQNKMVDLHAGIWMTVKNRI